MKDQDGGGVWKKRESEAGAVVGLLASCGWMDADVLVSFAVVCCWCGSGSEERGRDERGRVEREADSTS